MPSQLSRAHDARWRPDLLLGMAQMLKWLVWTPTRVMSSGMLQGHVGTKVAASDGRAASGKGSLQQICARRAFQPIQHLCHAKQRIWTPTRVMRSEMLQGH
eukprot:3921011-Rhodomonas_salina.1